jgi:UDP-N-acetylmuramoylalanine--D-glutamate ligase
MTTVDLQHLPFTKRTWRGRRVLILGLGQYPKGSGVTAALLFAKLGASVTVTDLKTAAALRANVTRLKPYKNVRFVLGRHELDDVRHAELIVANQRVRQDSREMKLARRLNIPITSEIALFLNHCSATVIAVTGTRGKSTTAALIAAMLRENTPPRRGGAGGGRVWLGGNILVSPLTFLSRITKKDFIVLELSSFQCEWLYQATSPHIAVITNIMRDHLNAYPSMDAYAEAKAQIFRHQTKKDIVILNANDTYGKRWAKEAPGRVIEFKIEMDPKFKTKLIGAHNALNIAAASAAARAAGVSATAIRRAIALFKPLPHRLEPVATKRGVLYVNDTCATTPDGTMAAMRSFLDARHHHHIWCIVGGADKELDYTMLASYAARHRPHIHFLIVPGDASVKLERALRAEKVHFHEVDDLAQAVRFAHERALPRDVVLLSPGAASFNQFANEFERGEEFRRSVKRILQRGS